MTITPDAILLCLGILLAGLYFALSLALRSPPGTDGGTRANRLDRLAKAAGLCAALVLCVFAWRRSDVILLFSLAFFLILVFPSKANKREKAPGKRTDGNGRLGPI